MSTNNGMCQIRISKTTVLITQRKRKTRPAAFGAVGYRTLKTEASKLLNRKVLAPSVEKVSKSVVTNTLLPVIWALEKAQHDK